MNRPRPRSRPARTDTPYRVSVEGVHHLSPAGVLVRARLLAPRRVAELKQHTEELMQGRLP